MKIRIIDTICGKGKSTGMIREINNNLIEHNDSYLFVTPFLNEVDRVIEECKDSNFKQPERSKYKPKYLDLMDLVNEEQNIVMTHTLLKNLSISQLSKFKEYHLVLDEVLDLVSQYKTVPPKDIAKMLEDKTIEAEDSGLLRILKEEDFAYTNFVEMKRLIDEEKLYLYGGKAVVFELPVEIITSFKSATILSYMVEGSWLYQLLKAHNLTVLKKQISDNGDIIDWNKELADKRAKEAFKLITLHYSDNERNDYNLKMLKTERVLSYSAQKAWNKERRLKVGNIVRNYFRSESGLSKYCMYSSYGDKMNIKDFCYDECFVAYSCRATNDYSHKNILAYVIDKYNNPVLTNYVKEKYDVEVDSDKASLDCLIQWIFRSSIRGGEPINLFLPSKRMRELLIKWGNGGLN